MERDDVGHLADLVDAVIGDAAPFGKPRQAAFVGDPAAQLLSGFGQRDVITSLAERYRNIFRILTDRELAD